MATSTTIIDGVLEDALANPIANEYIYFKLKQAGADNSVVPTTVYARGFVQGVTNASGEVKAIDGTSDLELWVNGDKGVQSVYEITTKSGKIEPTQVIIPISAAGSSIAIGELLISHSVVSQPSQTTTINEAKSYTDALASDPSSNGSFSDANWRADLNVEDGATADQTGAEIKSLYEAEANTNAFTDAEKTKLSGIEPNATTDQTGAEIKSLYEAELDTNAFTDAEKTKLANISSGATGNQTGAEIKVLYEGEPNTNAFTDAEKTKLTGIESNATADQTGAEIKSLYEAEADTNAFTDTEKSKLSGIESDATADQTGAEIKSLYEAEADTNAFTDAEQSKLSGIESNATADQTGAEIKALYEGEANTNAFTDTEKTKLASLESVSVSSSRSSVTFPTTSDYLSIADNSAIDLSTGDFSFSFWARLSGTGIEPVLFKQSTTGYEVYFSSGNLFLTLKDSGGQSDFQVASSLNDDTWKCYIITVDRSGNAIAYVNGVAQTPVDVSSRPLSLDNAVDLYIGSDGINAANDLALSDYVVIHKSILSASTVNSFYYSPELSSTTSSPTLAVDLRRPTDEVEDVSSSSLPIVKNGSIQFGNVRNKAFTAADEARLDGIISGSGGGQIGTNSSASAGGAIGVSSSETSGGGAVGYFTSTTTGGAVGFFTNSTTGGAVGYVANTTTGGAIGAGATSLDGFSGGSTAVSNAAGAVQLGQGTNATASTIQFRSSGSVTETQFGKLSDFGDKDTETTITDDDTKIPTSGAVVDHLANKPIAATTPVSTTTYTATSSDRTVLVDDDTAGADVTITLPSAVTVGDGWSVRVKKEGSTGDVTIDPNGAETIDGNADMVLQHKNQATSLISDGTNWCRLYPTTASGWAYYKDAEYDDSALPGSALVPTSGTRTQLTIDGLEGTTNTSYLPDGVTDFWDTTSDFIIAERLGDSFDVRIAFNVDVPANTESIKVQLDIGSGTEINIVTQTLQFAESGSQFVTFSFPIFTLATFLANGGKIYITTSAAGFAIWGASIFIKRDFSPL